MEVEPSGLRKLFSGECDGQVTSLPGHGRARRRFDQEIQHEPGRALHERISPRLEEGPVAVVSGNVPSGAAPSRPPPTGQMPHTPSAGVVKPQMSDR